MHTGEGFYEKTEIVIILNTDNVGLYLNKKFGKLSFEGLFKGKS